MNNSEQEIQKDFHSVVDELPHIGLKRHTGTLVDHAQSNLPFVKKSIKDLPSLAGAKLQSGIVISAGPTVHRRNIIKRVLDSKYKGTIIAVDGCYVACLKAGLIPDFVITLDPSVLRVVRWFGDPNFEENTKNDDYFARQDLDIEFRKNSIEHNNNNIKLVDRHGHLSKAIVASCSSESVVSRLRQAKFDMYWWNPLVDDPYDENSLTRKLYSINKLPCMNTGGTVGTAAWVFASTRLKLKKIAVTGMDYGYYRDTPYSQTQTYYELINHVGSMDEIEKFFVEYEFPLTGEKFYTDPTYFWYRRNFLELLHNAQGSEVFNCSEGGTLFDKKMPCIALDEFLNDNQTYGTT